MATFGINLLNNEPFLLSVDLSSGTSSSGGTLNTDIVSMFDVGNIKAGDTLNDGTTFTQFVTKLLLSTFNPTYTLPTFSLASNQPTNVESGLIGNIILTYNFNRGSINGKMVGGVWQFGAFQDFRAGAALKYIIQGQDMLLSNSRTIVNQNFIDGANSFSGSIQYDIGPQPLNSDNNPYQLPYPANTVISGSIVYGRRRAFYGYSNLGNTSAAIRSLSGNILNPINGSTFTINVPIGATNVVFAYPATLQNVTSVRYVEGLNADIKGAFTQTIVSVEGLNAYNPINYKVYIYVPVEPFTSTATYSVTI